MKILVIGNGFIGSSIIKRLESEGHDLLVFSRTFKDSCHSQQITADIFNFEEFIKTFSWNPQVIIHTAWITDHSIYAEHPSNFQYAQFTTSLVKSVSQTNLEHLIILGSCAEYGWEFQECSAGNTELNPITFYARQKVSAFNVAKELLGKSKVRLTWARIFQPYGKYQDSHRLIPYLIDSIKCGNRIELRDTSTTLDWVSTRDIASAISWIIKNDTPLEVDIGTGIGYTNVELLRNLESLMGNTNQWTQFDDQLNTTSRTILVGKDSPLFASGWRPSDTLQLGLEWSLEAWHD